MAKIKGIELRRVNDFRGHEGEPLTQGDVYYNDKKVGYYSQDAWGGMDILNLDYNLDKELLEEVNDVVNNYVGGVLFKKIDDLYNEKYNVNFHYEQKGYEYLFMDLLQLMEHEKLYKEYSKKFGTDNIAIIYKDLFDTAIYGNKNNIKIDVKFPNTTYFEYKSMKDFIKE